MKNKFTLIFAFATIMLSLSSVAQVNYSQDFEGAGTSLPNGWTQISAATDGGFLRGTNTDLSSTSMAFSSHTTFIATNDDGCGQVCDKGNEIVMSPVMNLTGVANPFLKVDIFYFEGAYQGITETAFIEASTDGGSTWTIISDLAGAADWRTEFVSLSAYANAPSLTIGFRYKDNGGWLFGFGIDDFSVFTPPQNSVDLSSLNINSYVVQTGNDIAGTVFNSGALPITSLTVSYTVTGSSAVTSTINGLNIAPFSSGNFIHPTQWVPSSPGTFNVSVTVSNPNGVTDAVLSNNTLSKSVIVATQSVQRLPLLEEFTSSTCPPCASFNSTFNPLLEQMQVNSGPNALAAIVKYQMNYPSPGNDPSYNSDASTRSTYYSVPGIPDPFLDGVNASAITSFIQPAVELRRSDIAVMSVGVNATQIGDSLVADVTITPYTNFPAGFKLYIAVTEDQYDYTGTNGETQFHNVMRKMLPDASGITLTAMTPNTPLTFTRKYKFSYNLDNTSQGSFNLWGADFTDVTVVAWVQDNATKEIFQAAFDESVTSLLGTITGNGFSSSNNPAPLSFSVITSGCPSFSYQWYSTSGIVSAPTGSSTIGWTLIPGATSNTYDPPTINTSTSYACFVTPLSSCGSAGWAAGVATYSIVSSLGAITGNGYSSSNNPASLSFSAISSGCPSFSYQWYLTSGVVSAPTGNSTIGWTLIPGATSNSYDPPTLFNSTSYACFVTPSFGCLTSGWAGGVASFNITTSSGSVNGQQVSQCTSSSVPLSFSSLPVGLGNTTYQWYFANGAVSCPQGNSTSGWTAIAGATSSTSSFVPPSSGTYTLACLVTPEGITGLPSQWANGCKTVVVNNFTAQPIIGNPNITPFTPYTYLVSQVSGHTYSWTAYGGAVSTGQNTNQVSIIWAATGPYQVMLVENNGVCSDTSYLDVVSSSCALTVNVIPIDPTTFCANGQARLIANASSGVSYQWKLNGSILPGATNDTLVATTSGSYQAIAVLDATCSAISQPISLTELPSLTAPVITLNGSPSSCNSVAPTLTANGNFATFLWNTGEISQSITPAASGNYIVSVSDVNGCTAQSIPQVVNLALLPPVDICVVSVDSLTGRNIVVWEKPFTTLIDSFVVFRESVVANVYEPIGIQAYGNFSTFIDPQSNPLAQASRYKLGLVDTCGTLSSTSDMHKTMHLTLNLGVGGTVNLIWSGYEGINFGSYKIYRGTALDNMSLLITIQSSLNSYTDLTPPSGTVYYQLEIVIPGCNPTAFGFLSSRSNIANTGAIGFEQLNLDEVRVFPNPTDVGFTVQSKAIIESESIELLDQLGRVVIQTHTAANSTFISTAHLAKGIYFLRLPKHPGYSQKLIVN